MAAVLGTTGLAGCGIIGGGGSTTQAGNWQYDPSILASTSNVVFGSMNYGEMYAMRDDLPESMQDDFEIEQEEDSPVDPGDFDQMIGVGGGSFSPNTGSSGGVGSLSMIGSVAITGTFDRQAMVDQIEEEEGEVSESGEYEGYTLYEVPDIDETSMGGVGQGYQGSATVGVGDSAVVIGLSVAQGTSVEATGEEAVQAMVDSSAGNARRLSATSGPAQNLQSRLNDSLLAVGVEVDPDLVNTAQDAYGQGSMAAMAGMVDGMRGIGFGGDIDPQTTTFSYVLLYDSGSSAEESGIVQLLGSSTDDYEQREGIDSVSIEREGEAIVAEISGDTETLFDQGGPTGGTFDVAPPSP